MDGLINNTYIMFYCFPIPPIVITLHHLQIAIQEMIYANL